MTTGRQNEWYATLIEAIGNRPGILAVPEVNVDNRNIEPAFLDFRQGFANTIDGRDDPMAKGIEEVLEHHRDQRLILDDQD